MRAVRWLVRAKGLQKLEHSPPGGLEYLHLSSSSNAKLAMTWPSQLRGVIVM